MYGRYHFHLHTNPLKRLVYGILGGPRLSDWVRFCNVERMLKKEDVSGIRQILDAGCGLGFYSLMLAERFPQATITAVDDDSSLVKGLQETSRSMGYRSIIVSKENLTAFVPEKQFNLICCVDVMEHIVDHDVVYNNFANWLAPGGILIMHVPQKNQKFLFIKRTHGGDDPHCREGYDPSELKVLLESKGLKLVFHKQTFGRLAALGVEFDEILWKSRLYPVWLLFYPLFLLIAGWDLVNQGKSGHGILIKAHKYV